MIETTVTVGKEGEVVYTIDPSIFVSEEKRTVNSQIIMVR